MNFLQDDWVFWLLSTEFVINKHVSETTQCILSLINLKQHLKMGLEPDFFVNKFMDFPKKNAR